MTATTPATPAPSSPPLEDDVECLIKRPHWSRRLVVHIFRMALAMGLAFAISVFAVVLYVSDYKTKPQPVSHPPVAAPESSEANQPAYNTEPSGDEPLASQQTVKDVLQWIFGN